MQKKCLAQPLEHWPWDFRISFNLTWSKLISTAHGIMLSVVNIICNTLLHSEWSNYIVFWPFSSLSVSLSGSNIQFLQSSKTDPP